MAEHSGSVGNESLSNAGLSAMVVQKLRTIFAQLQIQPYDDELLLGSLLERLLPGSGRETRARQRAAIVLFARTDVVRGMHQCAGASVTRETFERWVEQCRAILNTATNTATITIDFKREDARFAVQSWCALFAVTTVADAANQSHIATDFEPCVDTFAVGQLLQFGAYDAEPILWRVIDVDQSGQALLLTENIIAFKAFDAPGPFHKDKDRARKGSNYWADSNLRQWLNSRDSKIVWQQNRPSASNCVRAEFAYDMEPGFLSAKNFSRQERALIVPTTFQSTLPADERAMMRTSSIEVEDYVFCLSMEQLHAYAQRYRSLLKRDFTIAAPTASAERWLLRKPDSINPSGHWYYWLSTPHPSFPYYVRAVSLDGRIRSREASAGLGGVRPALRLAARAIGAANIIHL